MKIVGETEPSHSSIHFLAGTHLNLLDDVLYDGNSFSGFGTLWGLGLFDEHGNWDRRRLLGSRKEELALLLVQRGRPFPK